MKLRIFQTLCLVVVTAKLGHEDLRRDWPASTLPRSAAR
jgi:hypothetical protein